jgi:ubiquinone/menaquinone biosynthesis C-methylase UbiE
MNKKDTSWGKVADWYSDYLGNEDTFQAQVILPNLVRVVSPKPGQKILDLACGQGFFAREFAKLGAQVVGADISPELIAEAKKEGGDVVYHVAPAHQLSFAKDAEFDVVVCVLALQNIEDLGGVYKEVARVLKPGGKLVMVS